MHVHQPEMARGIPGRTLGVADVKLRHVNGSSSTNYVSLAAKYCLRKQQVGRPHEMTEV